MYETGKHTNLVVFSVNFTRNSRIFKRWRNEEKKWFPIQKKKKTWFKIVVWILRQNPFVFARRLWEEKNGNVPSQLFFLHEFHCLAIETQPKFMPSQQEIGNKVQRRCHATNELKYNVLIVYSWYINELILQNRSTYFPPEVIRQNCIA